MHPVKTDALVDDVGPFEKMISFEISPGDFNQAMNRASRQISRQLNIAGFRPGRAPRRMVENRVGVERIRTEALEDLVPTRMTQILARTEITPVVPPLMESATDTPNGSVRVKVRVTTWPRLESAPSYRGREITIGEFPPVSEEVETMLEQLRYVNAPLEAVDRAVESGDFVIMDMTVKDGDRPIESLALDGFSYEVGSERLTPRIDESLLGREAGEEVEVRAPLPGWLEPDPSPEEDTPGEGETSGARAESLYEIRIAEVQSRSLPDLDDDWASEYTGHDSLDELREEIAEDAEERRNSAQWQELVAETMKEMASAMDLEIPERLVSAQTEILFHNHLHALEQSGMDYGTYLEEMNLDHQQVIEILTGQALDGLRKQILVEKVIDEEKLLVDDREVLDVLRRAAKDAEDPEQFRQEMEKGGRPERIRSDMLRARAQAFMAMRVQPVDGNGQPVQVEPPKWVKDWFRPVTLTDENADQGGDLGEALYEAEVIDDSYPD